MFITEIQDAPHLFKKITSKAGVSEIVYHNYIKVQHHAREALALTSAENPDMSTEEILEEQKRILEEISKQKEAPAASRGRGIEGRGKGRSKKAAQTRFSEIRIEEITDNPQKGKKKKTPLFLEMTPDNIFNVPFRSPIYLQFQSATLAPSNPLNVLLFTDLPYHICPIYLKI